MKFLDITYKKIVKPIIFLFDPEFVHHVFIFFGRVLGSNSLGRYSTSFLYGYKGKDKSRTIDGITYKTPVLLSAGFDYDGHLSQILPFVSFGGEEIGSVTAKLCEGNPKPRLRRLINNKSIAVYKGLRNSGVDALIARLQDTKRIEGFVLGISIARTNDACSAEVDDAIEDYAYSFSRLNEESVGDYYTINISCPNAHSGEIFLESNALNDLLQRLSEIKCEKPVYIKMPINIEWDAFRKLLDTAQKFDFIKGYVIGNLNKNYDELPDQSERPEKFIGGLSGKVCFERSNNLIRKTRDYIGPDTTIIGVGGISSADDAMEKFEAGADLIQLITGMIYEGPQLIKKICLELEKRV